MFEFPDISGLTNNITQALSNIPQNSVGTRPITSAMARNPSAYASFARQPEAGGAQAATQAPSNPFAGANPPAAPSVPTQQTTAAQANAQQAMMAPRPAYHQPVFRQQLGYPQQGYPQQGYQQQMPQMPQQPAQSVTQQASRGGAQSISNYLSALKQAGAGTSNAMMATPGQLGQGPQAGFMGFGQNGMQTQLGGRFVGPQQQYGGLQFQNNMASAANNYFAGNQAYSPRMMQAAGPTLANAGGYTTGGTGGVAGQPQWQTPAPWMNPADPAQSDAAWDAMSTDEKSAYLGAPREGGFESSDTKPPQSYDYPTTQGSFYSTSDERAKENIAPAKTELEDFMNQLGVYSYEYKNKEHGEGRYISPMAQEFEKSNLGKQAVVTDPETGLKKVNYGKLMGVNTAALALVNHKLNKLEADFKKALKANLKRTK